MAADVALSAKEGSALRVPDEPPGDWGASTKVANDGSYFDDGSCSDEGSHLDFDFDECSWCDENEGLMLERPDVEAGSSGLARHQAGPSASVGGELARRPKRLNASLLPAAACRAADRRADRRADERDADRRDADRREADRRDPGLAGPKDNFSAGRGRTQTGPGPFVNGGG